MFTSCMESPQIRHLNYASCKCAQNRISGLSSLAESSHTDLFFKGPSGADNKSISGMVSIGFTRMYQQHSSGFRRQEIQTSYKPQGLEFLASILAFKDGRHSSYKKLLVARRLASKAVSQGCISDGSNSYSRSEVPRRAPRVSSGCRGA